MRQKLQKRSYERCTLEKRFRILPISHDVQKFQWQAIVIICVLEKCLTFLFTLPIKLKCVPVHLGKH